MKQEVNVHWAQKLIQSKRAWIILLLTLNAWMLVYLMWEGIAWLISLVL